MLNKWMIVIELNWIELNWMDFAESDESEYVYDTACMTCMEIAFDAPGSYVYDMIRYR